MTVQQVETTVDGFKNRDRKEIIGQMISLIQKNPGIRRTKLQFSSYLSSKQMTYFMEKMEKANLIEMDLDENGKAYGYITTMKGDKYIRIWSELEDLLKA